MASITQMPSNVKFIIQMSDCYLHKFDHRVRVLLDEGHFQIFQRNMIDETPSEEILFYVKVNNFFKIFKKSQVFIKIRYTGSVCYLFQCTQSQSIYCLSFPAGIQGLQKFQIDMGQLFMVIDFNSELLDQKLREKIKNNCSQNLEHEDISYQAKRTIKKIGNSVGLIFGKASNIIQGPTTINTVSALSDRANHFYDETISQNVKSKWNSVKQISQSINNKMTVVVAPVMKLIDNISSQIGKSFYNSENNVVKTVRQSCLTLSKSLNEGERKAREDNTRNSTMKQQISALQMR